MVITMDGSKLLSMIREDDGMHLYFQERDPNLPEDKIVPKRKENFHPAPIVEIHMPKDKTLVLIAASLLLYMTDDEKLEVFREYQRGIKG